MIVFDLEKLIIPCEPATVEEGEDITRQLSAILLKEETGVGLAAPQIGILKQVFIIRPASDSSRTESFINPEIISMEEPFVHENEGCLSFPNEWVNTIRYRKISISDVHGIKQFSDFPAVICQHENDHLHGITMYDRMVPNSYSSCFCGSGKKFKFCHRRKLKKEWDARRKK